jgi:hypothetical protein
MHGAPRYFLDTYAQSRHSSPRLCKWNRLSVMLLHMDHFLMAAITTGWDIVDCWNTAPNHCRLHMGDSSAAQHVLAKAAKRLSQNLRNDLQGMHSLFDPCTATSLAASPHIDCLLPSLLYFWILTAFLQLNSLPAVAASIAKNWQGHSLPEVAAYFETMRKK